MGKDGKDSKYDVTENLWNNLSSYSWIEYSVLLLPANFMFLSLSIPSK